LFGDRQCEHRVQADDGQQDRQTRKEFEEGQVRLSWCLVRGDDPLHQCDVNNTVRTHLTQALTNRWDDARRRCGRPDHEIANGKSRLLKHDIDVEGHGSHLPIPDVPRHTHDSPPWCGRASQIEARRPDPFADRRLSRAMPTWQVFR
jgi:hypothetical protein